MASRGVSHVLTPRHNKEREASPRTRPWAWRRYPWVASEELPLIREDHGSRTRQAGWKGKEAETGKKEIDLFHRFHGLQHIAKKPVAKMLEEAQFACMREDEPDDGFCELPGISALDIEPRPVWEREEGFAGASYANPYNKNSDVRYHTGHAERRQCLHTFVQEAKQEGLVTTSIDPPEARSTTMFGLFVDPFIDAGALVSDAGGGEGDAPGVL